MRGEEKRRRTLPGRQRAVDSRPAQRNSSKVGYPCLPVPLPRERNESNRRGNQNPNNASSLPRVSNTELPRIGLHTTPHPKRRDNSSSALTATRTYKRRPNLSTLRPPVPKPLRLRIQQHCHPHHDPNFITALVKTTLECADTNSN